MSKNKKKFDLTHLVHAEYVHAGEKLFFVSDPSKFCEVVKLPNGEFKVQVGEGKTAKVITIHAFAHDCLGDEPPEHASRWVRVASGKTLYELWQHDLEQDQAA